MIWRIAILALASVVEPALAGSISFSFNLNGAAVGTPTASGISYSFFGNPITGTLAPFGNCTANLADPKAFTFTLANGITLTSTAVSQPSEPPQFYNFTGTITGGTGIFANATGAYQMIVTGTKGTSTAIPFTVTGSGTVDAPDAPGGASLLPLSLVFQSNGNTVSHPQVLVLNNQGLTALTFSTSTTVLSGPNWLSASANSTSVGAASSSSIVATANPNGLKTGVYKADLHVDYGAVDLLIPARFIVGNGGGALQTSLTGLNFSALLDGPAPAAETFQVNNVGIGNLSGLTAATSVTGSVPNWLQATIAPGFANQNQAQVTVTANPGSLLVGTYYGQIAFTMPNTINSPQTLTVQMVVGQGPTPTFQPADVSFTVPSDPDNGTFGPIPPAVNMAVTNPRSVALNFTITPDTPQWGAPPSWFQITPTSGTIPPGGTTQIVVALNPANVSTIEINNAYAVVNVNFPLLNYTYTLWTQAVVTGTSNQPPIPPWGSNVPGYGTGSFHSGDLRPQASTASCTPAFLGGFITSIPPEFQATVGQPMPLEAQLYDNCGNGLNDGSVMATLASGESPVVLNPLGGGQWSATWTPRKSGSYNGITLQGASQDGIFGSLIWPGSVADSTATPIIDSGGVVDAASGSAVIAPGDFISIYGANMAGGTTVASGAPFPASLGSTQVFLGGEPLPLYFTATGQIDAIVPYDIAVNGAQQVVVQAGNALSQPEPVTVASAAPAVFTQNQSGSGPGAIQGLKPGGAPILNTSANPSAAGDALIIYCTGLGTVHPPVPAGVAAPTNALSYTDETVTVTVGGQNAQVLFAGLAPGYVGLYQVNAILPAGIPASDSVPVVLTAGGLSSAPVTVSIR